MLQEGEKGWGWSCSLTALHHSPSWEGWGTQEGWETHWQATLPPTCPQPPGWTRDYLLEAQHTNTFIFRQARRWLCVGVAARQERAGMAPQRVTPAPGTQRLGGSGHGGVWPCLGVRSRLGGCSSIPILLSEAAPVSAPCIPTLHQHPPAL